MDINEKLIMAYDAETDKENEALKDRMSMLRAILSKGNPYSVTLKKADEILETARVAAKTSFFRTLPEVKNPAITGYRTDRIVANGFTHRLGIHHDFSKIMLTVEGGGACGDVDLVYDGTMRFVSDENPERTYNEFDLANNMSLYNSAMDRHRTFIMDMDTYYDRFYTMINEYIDARL